MRGRARVARLAAPAAFLAAATVAILVVRSGLDSSDPTPAPAGATTTAPARTEPVTTAPTTTGGTATVAAEFYVIQAGDTLAAVADRHGTTVEQLLVLNPEVDPVSLNIGDRIRVK